MLPSVYIESSIVGYLVARPSRDEAMARRQGQFEPPVLCTPDDLLRR